MATLSSSQVQGLIAINVTAVIVGTAALFGKLDVSPFWIVAMRSAFAALAMAAFALYRGQLEIPARSDRVAILGTGALLAAHWLSFFYSVQLAGVAVATLTFASFPLFTVLIDAVHQRRRLHLIELLAALAIVFAVWLLVDIDDSATTMVLGALSGLGSAVTYACFWILSKALSQRLNALSLSISQNFIVALILLPLLAFATPFPDEPREWLLLGALGIIVTAATHQLYYYSLHRLSAAVCSGFIALEPVYAILFAAMFFDERITLAVIVSGALIIGASYLLLRLERKGPQRFPE